MLPGIGVGNRNHPVSMAAPAPSRISPVHSVLTQVSQGVAHCAQRAASHLWAPIEELRALWTDAVDAARAMAVEPMGGNAAVMGASWMAMTSDDGAASRAGAAVGVPAAIVSTVPIDHIILEFQSRIRWVEEMLRNQARYDRPQPTESEIEERIAARVAAEHTAVAACVRAMLALGLSEHTMRVWLELGIVEAVDSGRRYGFLGVQYLIDILAEATQAYSPSERADFFLFFGERLDQYGYQPLTLSAEDRLRLRDTLRIIYGLDQQQRAVGREAWRDLAHSNLHGATHRLQECAGLTADALVVENLCDPEVFAEIDDNQQFMARPLRPEIESSELFQALHATIDGNARDILRSTEALHDLLVVARAHGLTDASVQRWIDTLRFGIDVKAMCSLQQFLVLALEVVADASIAVRNVWSDALAIGFQTDDTGIFPDLAGHGRDELLRFCRDLVARLQVSAEITHKPPCYRAVAAVAGALEAYQEAAAILTNEKLDSADQINPNAEYFVLEQRIARQYARRVGLRELGADRAYTHESLPVWQKRFKSTEAWVGLSTDAPVPTVVRLADILPHQNVFRTPTQQSEFAASVYAKPERQLTYLDSINGIRRMMLYYWKRTDLSETERLNYMLRTHVGQRKGMGGVNVSLQHTVPLVSLPDRHGRYVLLDGHHRLSTLISLVHEGLLPARLLDAIPCESLNADPVALVAETAAKIDVPSFGWADVVAFNSELAAFVHAHGLQHDLRSVLE